jgi:hypothetical protein
VERRGGLLTVLAALATVRVGIALAALLAEGTKLPAIPAFHWHGFEGDANGYYAAAREAISSAASPGVAAVAAAALLLGVGLARLLRRRRAASWTQLLARLAGLAGAATAVVAGMEPPGAPVVGWPLVWAVPLAPVRLVGEPSVEAAWGIGVAVSLACVAAATVACGLLGRRATGSDAVAIGAAGLFTAWPLVTGTIAGDQAWENGTWLVDAGLHLYSEPLSTALVTASLVLLLGTSAGETTHVAAGALLGFATVVKLTNGLVAVALLPLVAWRRGVRATGGYAAGGLVFAPLVAAYWDKGYPAIYGGGISASDEPWSLDYVASNWEHSLLFTPTVLAVLAPLAIAGALAVRDRWALAVLIVPMAVTALVYSLYDVTAMHPRFLFVALPSLFVLEAAGAVALVRELRIGARRALGRPAA